eukprot:530559-Pyramimonas_sp.AAC.1
MACSPVDASVDEETHDVFVVEHQIMLISSLNLPGGAWKHDCSTWLLPGSALTAWAHYPL